METSKELMYKAYSCQKGSRVPFSPSVYEHRGFLIGRSPSEIAQDPNLMYEGLLVEHETYHGDFMTVGVDLYNVEAEALGAKVSFFEDSNSVPGIAGKIIKSKDDFYKLKIPDPEKAGRMPMHLEVAERIHKKLGNEVYIKGALCGPVSMASELMGVEDLAVLTYEDPQYAKDILNFCAEVSAAYGKAYWDRGVHPAAFDSRAAPPMFSPKVFHEIIRPAFADHLYKPLKDYGVPFASLVVGNDTTSIIDDYFNTGASRVLCDFGSDIEEFKKYSERYKVAIRVNSNPLTLHSGPIDKIQESVRNVIDRCKDHPGFILGTGVCVYDVPSENIFAIQEVLKSYE